MAREAKGRLCAFAAWVCLGAATGPAPAIAGAQMIELHGVKVLRLSGTREEMARGHGELVRSVWQDTALPYFAQKIATSVGQTYIAKDLPAIGDVMKWGVGAAIVQPLARRIPDEDERVLSAFAEAAGIPRDEALAAFVVPDAGQWLLASVFGSRKVDPALTGVPSPFGCSTFVSSKGDVSTGWIHARNLDYDSFGIFDRMPAVIFFDPSEPGAQRYASFTSFGIHTAGITAINASGIALSLHQIMVDDVSTRGTSILSINDRVIREAHTLDEAVAILRASHAAGSWAVQLSSSRERRAVSVEISAGMLNVREMQGPDLVMTNHVFGEKMRRKEFAFSVRYPRDSHLRFEALQGELEHRGVLDAQAAVDLISGAFQREGATGGKPLMLGSVGKGNNIQSVVMLPDRKLAYLAVPSREMAKPVDGQYVAIPLDFESIGSAEDFEASLAAAPAPLAASQPLAPAAVDAQRLLRQAAAAATDLGRYEVALGLLREASAEQPKEPHYALAAALMAFRLAGEAQTEGARREALDEAFIRLEMAVSLGLDAYGEALSHLLRARYYDLLGRRGDALSEYQRVDRSFSPALAKAADTGARRPYRARALRMLVVDVLLGDLYRF